MSWVNEIGGMVKALQDQAAVHDRNPKPCAGLPYCVSCRAQALLNNDLNIRVAEAWIATQDAGTVVERIAR